MNWRGALFWILCAGGAYKMGQTPLDGAAPVVAVTFYYVSKVVATACLLLALSALYSNPEEP